MAAPALNDDSDGDLDLPELEPVQLSAQQRQLPSGGNPFSPLRSPAQPDPSAVLEQLAATTQLLSNIVLGQSGGREKAPYASFSEANKVLNRPSEFGSLSHEADLAAWQDWSHSFRTWLTFADGEYERLLKVIEDNIDHAVVLEYESDEIRDKSQKLYAVLSGLLKHKPRTFLKQIPNRNGLELWRQLLQTYAPKTRARSLAVLNALTGAPAFSKDKSLQEQVFALERMSAEYTRISGRSVGEDILLGTLLRCLPANIRQHCQLVMNDRTTYDQLRAYVLSYEITTTTWSASRVQQALGVTSQPAEQGAIPMEIDRLAGKGKYGKGKDGKGKYGKGKGKGKDAKGADAGKGKDKHPKGKDKGDKQPKSADRNQCLYCGKQGHWKRDCKRYKADVKAGKVRAVGADEPIGLNDIAEFEYKQAMKQAVRAVRTTTSGSVNKQVLQGIVLAVASALGRATDTSDEDGDSNDRDIEFPQWANRILVWVLGLWVRDDSGVSIIDLITSHAAPILCMCILMMFVAMCFRFWCARPPSRQVQVQVSDQRQHGAVSVRFDQNLNVQVGVAAPGTPANPLAVDSEDDAVSPPHVLHAMRKGARSKASARPGPRCDEPASSSDTRAGVEPPPPEPFVRAPSSAPPTPEGSVGSTGSFRDAHGYQVAVARRLEHPQDAVWVSTYGRCYHRLRCFKLDGCDRIRRLPLADAVARGYRPCKKCTP